MTGPLIADRSVNGGFGVLKNILSVSKKTLKLLWTYRFFIWTHILRYGRQNNDPPPKMSISYSPKSVKMLLYMATESLQI